MTLGGCGQLELWMLQQCGFGQLEVFDLFFQQLIREEWEELQRKEKESMATKDKERKEKEVTIFFLLITF